MTFPGSYSVSLALPLHDWLQRELFSARLPQSITIYDRNLTRGRSSALTLWSSLTSPTGVRKIFACARCCHAIPERTRAVRPFRSSVHSCQSSLLRHQNGDQNRMTRYPLHVDALYIALTHTKYMHTYITDTSLNPVVQLSTSYVKSFEIDNLPNREKTDRKGKISACPSWTNIHKTLAFEGTISSSISGWLSTHKLSHRTHMLNHCGKIFWEPTKANEKPRWIAHEWAAYAMRLPAVEWAAHARDGCENWTCLEVR